MEKFTELIKSLTDGKIEFKTFHKQWQELYLNEKVYETLSETEKDIVDEIHNQEDFVLESEGELQDVRKYNFISISEFISWLKNRQHE